MFFLICKTPVTNINNQGNIDCIWYRPNYTKTYLIFLSRRFTQKITIDNHNSPKLSKSTSHKITDYK